MCLLKISLPGQGDTGGWEGGQEPSLQEDTATHVSQQRPQAPGTVSVKSGASVTWLLGPSPRQPCEGKTEMCPFYRRIREAEPGFHTGLPRPQAGATRALRPMSTNNPPTGPRATGAALVFSFATWAPRAAKGPAGQRDVGWEDGA